MVLRVLAVGRRHHPGEARRAVRVRVVHRLRKRRDVVPVLVVLLHIPAHARLALGLVHEREAPEEVAPGP